MQAMPRVLALDVPGYETAEEGGDRPRGAGPSSEALPDSSRGTLQKAVERCFDELAPPLEGRSVLIKPNMVVAWPADWGATTHPALVRACVAEVTRRGGRPMVGDSPGASYMNRVKAVARKTGVLEAAGSAYVSLADRVEERTLSDGGEQVPISRAALDADVVISLPKLKTHSLTLLTGAVKNSYGLIPGAKKSELHRQRPDPEGFSRIVVDVFEIRPPDMIIMDAVVAMQGNGPSTRDLRHVGKLIASTSGPAADVVAARMMGLSAGDVPTLAIAAERGLGPGDLALIELEGRADPVRDFRLPMVHRLRRLASLGSTVASGTFHAAMSQPKLRVRADRCTLCRACIKGCPMSAIGLVRPSGLQALRAKKPARRHGLPRVDHGLCIACFCCMEQCPADAWAFSGWNRIMAGVGKLASEDLAALGDRLTRGARKSS